MNDVENLDRLFREAVTAIDAGAEATLQNLLAARPRLVRERLDSPGAWLRDQVGDALEDFFRAPYLLWFVAEDPVRNGKLPGNIARVAQVIIQAARREGVESLQEQLDHALRLVCWSWIAHDCGVQIELIDTLLDAGASPDGSSVYQGRYGTHSDSAVYNRNFAAAEHLLKRGAAPTLSTVLCLGLWADAERLARAATLGERQDALVQAARQGNAEALLRMLEFGVDVNAFGARDQSHATALHHAVWSGSVEAVRVLIEAGADPTRTDSIYQATPLGWAEYRAKEEKMEARAQQYRRIAALLRHQEERPAGTPNPPARHA